MSVPSAARSVSAVTVPSSSSLSKAGMSPGDSEIKKWACAHFPGRTIFLFYYSTGIAIWPVRRAAGKVLNKRELKAFASTPDRNAGTESGIHLGEFDAPI